MGEAGPEAIMPLTRGAEGKLGVRAEGAGGRSIVNNNYFTVSDVASVSLVRQAVSNSQRQIVAAFARLQNYGGAVA